MFVAMNHFKVNPDRADEFESAWRERDSHLAGVAGLRHFALLKGTDEGEYASHTTWDTREAFEAWARSDAFRAAHQGGPPQGVVLGHPQVKFWQAVLEETPAATE